MSNEMNQQLVWSDRKRILGMPISFTKYEMDRQRLTLSSGLFTTSVNELLLYRVLDIRSRQTLWQKLFNVGTIILYSADKTHPQLQLVNIKNPNGTRKFISKEVERERHTKRTVGKEMFGASGISMDDIYSDGMDSESDMQDL